MFGEETSRSRDFLTAQVAIRWIYIGTMYKVPLYDDQRKTYQDFIYDDKK